jgi:hypothetical protein
MAWWHGGKPSGSSNPTGSVIMNPAGTAVLMNPNGTAVVVKEP